MKKVQCKITYESKVYGWQVSRVINIVACSAKLGVNIPELDRRF